MNKNYRGPAESKEQEKKDLLNDMPVDEVAGASKGKDHKKPVARKKGGAKYIKGAGDYDVKKGSHGHPHGAGQMMIDESFAKADKALDKRTSQIYGGKKGSTNIVGKKMPGFNFMPPENPGNPDKMQSGKTMKRNHSKRGKPDYASAVYDANQDGDSFFHDKNQDGTMLGRGIKSAIKYFGGSRGYTQNFGPARQNSYAKGAAKVADIMGRGAAKGKGAAEYGGKKGDDSKSKKDYEK